MKFWVMCWNTMETDLNEFRASSNFVVTSCASPAVQENSWSLRVDHRKSLRFGSCYLPNANLVGECWFDPPWKVDSIPVLACTCFFLHVTTSLFDFSKNCDCDRFGSSQSCGHGGHVMGEPPAAEIETRGSSQGSDQGMGDALAQNGCKLGCFFFVGDAYCRWSWNLWWPQWCTSPTPSGGHGFSLVAKSFWRFLYWYFFQLLLVAGESCHQEHSRLVAEGQQCPKSLCDT